MNNWLCDILFRFLLRFWRWKWWLSIHCLTVRSSSWKRRLSITNLALRSTWRKFRQFTLRFIFIFAFLFFKINWRFFNRNLWFRFQFWGKCSWLSTCYFAVRPASLIQNLWILFTYRFAFFFFIWYYFLVFWIIFARFFSFRLIFILILLDLLWLFIRLYFLVFFTFLS